MNTETSTLLASIAVNIAELKLLESDIQHISELRAEILRYLQAKEDFTRKAIV